LSTSAPWPGWASFDILFLLGPVEEAPYGDAVLVDRSWCCWLIPRPRCLKPAVLFGPHITEKVVEVASGDQIRVAEPTFVSGKLLKLPQDVDVVFPGFWGQVWTLNEFSDEVL